MLSRTITFDELIESGNWRVDLHVHEDKEIYSQMYEVVALGDVVTESRDGIEPQRIEHKSVYFIGLENIESVTGEISVIRKVDSKSIRSRSKIFKIGDILYGRLRPNLRKAAIVEDPYDWGLCSTEFIILRPNESIVSSMFLRELLVSKPVTSRLVRYQGGAALPRISAKDLMKLKIPLPPMEIQMEITSKLADFKSQRKELKSKLEKLVQNNSKVILEVFK